MPSHSEHVLSWLGSPRRHNFKGSLGISLDCLKAKASTPQHRVVYSDMHLGRIGRCWHQRCGALLCSFLPISGVAGQSLHFRAWLVGQCRALRFRRELARRGSRFFCSSEQCSQRSWTTCLRTYMGQMQRARWKLRSCTGHGDSLLQYFSSWTSVLFEVDVFTPVVGNYDKLAIAYGYRAVDQAPNVRFADLSFGCSR